MAGLARRAERSTNIWPGFVDALATLLMVVMFLLMIFVLAQFFLSEALSGREQALDKLKVQVSELADLLSLEKKTNKDMRENLSQLSAELQSSVALRDELRTSVSLFRKNAIETNETLQKLESESKSAFTTILSLREKLAVADARVAELRTKLAAADAQAANLRENLTESNRKVSDLEAQNTISAEQLVNLQNQSVSREAEIDKLQDQSDQNLENITALTDQALKDQKLIEELQIKLSEAETQISILQKRSIASEQKIDEIEKSAEVTKISLTEAQDASAEYIRKIASLDRQIQLLDALKQDLQTKITEMAGKLTESGKTLLTEKEFSESARAEVALLNQQMSALRAQLAQIRTALEISEADTKAKNVQIANLGKRLNAALASKVQELSRYRSEFFGRLREVLGKRQGVQVVGDRFVFQSEVLFAKSAAEIATAGQLQLDQLATTLLEIALEIPGEIDWILRVDGHTDNDPIQTARYPSNWELSTARAISVVKHLVNAGLPADRLVAAGFGEFHPIDKRNDEISKRRNRRIELKLTQR